MAGTLVPVRFVRAWQNYRVGDEITPNGTLRDWLVQQGFAVLAGGAARAGERPARLSTRAARKVADGVKGLLGR